MLTSSQLRESGRVLRYNGARNHNGMDECSRLRDAFGCRCWRSSPASPAAPHGVSHVFLPYGSTQYEHNNNIFYLPNSTALYLTSGDSVLGDSDLKTVGGMDVNYLWGRQRFYGTIEGRNFEYDHYSDLNHDEYLVKAGLDWKLFSEFDGTFLSTTQRYMAPFANRDTFTQLAIDLDRDDDREIQLPD